MNEEKPDRRCLRTRQTLINALLELIETRHYDQISVQDVVQQANVGRSTFYAHYQNKDELLMSGFEYLLDRLVQQITLSDAGLLLFDTTMLFRHAHGHFEIYRTLIWGSGFELLIKDGHHTLSRKIEARLDVLLSGQCAPSVPLPLLSSTLAGELLLLLKWWLDNRMPYPPERMNEVFQQIMMPGLRAAVG